MNVIFSSRFELVPLADGCEFLVGDLPKYLGLDERKFTKLWDLHPPEYHEIKMHGRLVKTPRWQQAYGADYHYTGRVNTALAMPDLVQPFLEWTQSQVDSRLNGVLINWYDGQLNHYMGRHRDSTRHMTPGTPIVTISTGQHRVFHVRPWKGKGYRVFVAAEGSVVVMPNETNLAWTHEVPHLKENCGKRISLTMRSFETGVIARNTSD